MRNALVYVVERCRLADRGASAAPHGHLLGSSQTAARVTSAFEWCLHAGEARQPTRE